MKSASSDDNSGISSNIHANVFLGFSSIKVYASIDSNNSLLIASYLSIFDAATSKSKIFLFKINDFISVFEVGVTKILGVEISKLLYLVNVLINSSLDLIFF